MGFFLLGNAGTKALSSLLLLLCRDNWDEKRRLISHGVSVRKTKVKADLSSGFFLKSPFLRLVLSPFIRPQ